MIDLNTVTLSGNLTRDPELRQTASGKNVCSIRLASKTFGDKTVFTDVSAWEKLAELLNDALSKGSRLVLTGRLEYREWEDSDGKKRNAHSIVAQDVSLPPRDVSDDVDF